MTVRTVSKARIATQFKKVFPHKNFDKRLEQVLEALFPPLKPKKK